jgi:hypothetical protein
MDNARQKSNSEKELEQFEENRVKIMAVFVVIWIFAMYKALNCGANGNTKVIHALFASISPVLYLILSYLSKDFC